MINKQAFLTSLMGLTFTVGSFVTPISAFASSSGGSLEDMISQTTGKEDPIISTRYISNTEILSKLRTINPTAYDSIPADVLTAAYQQDFLRQGTTKIVKTSTGFKLYLNSAIVKSIKYAGYGAATAAAAAVAAAISAATFGIGTATIAAMGGVAAQVASEISGCRGVVINFSTRGALVSWYQQ